jgi:Domain of unknown function (DUF4276)
MVMTHHIIVEGPTDVAILKALLAPTLAAAKPSVTVDFMVGRGWSAAESLARSILAIDREPVALVIDADATSPAQVEERRAVTEGLLGLYAPRSRWVVILMVPEIEVLFFKDPDFLAHLLRLKTKVPPTVLRQAKFEPKAALAELLDASHSSYQELLDRVRHADPNPLLSTPEIERLCEFLGVEVGLTTKRLRPRRAVGR